MTDKKRPPHPGKTPAQRRVLDEIGCGNNSPIADKRTIQRLLDAGLIVELSERIEGEGWMRVHIRQFEMPIPVHMAWCDAVAAECNEDLL